MAGGENELLHIIAMGHEEDWKRGLGSLFYIEDKHGESAYPVFTAAELADKFVQARVSFAKLP